MGRSPRLATSTRAVGRPAFNSIGSAARRYSPGMIGIWFILFYSLAGARHSHGAGAPPPALGSGLSLADASRTLRAFALAVAGMAAGAIGLWIVTSLVPSGNVPST